MINLSTMKNSILSNSNIQKVVYQFLRIFKTMINCNIVKKKKKCLGYFHRLYSTLYFMAQQKSQLNLCYSLYH